MSKHEHDHRHDDHSHQAHQSTHSQGELSEENKLMKMVEHWIHHNEDHAKSYREWANRARRTGREDVCLILEEVAGSTHLQNENFQKVLDLLKQNLHVR